MTLLRQGRSFSGRERHCGFLNTGGAHRFADVSDVSGLSLPEDGTGVAFCDWDHDGKLDLWMSNRSGPQVRFFRNRAAWSGRSIRILLEGTHCNRDGIGARVTVVPSTGKAVTKTLRAGEGYLSQSSKWLHFGIGGGEVEEVLVRWPGGNAEAFSGVRSGGAFQLKQGEGISKNWSPPGEIAEFPGPVAQAANEDDFTSIVLGIPLPLPNLEFETDAGELAMLFGEPLSGNRGLLVNLWSGWCQPCVEELAEFTASQVQFESGGLGVIALNVDGLEGGEESSRQAREKLRELRFPFLSGRAPAGLIKFLQLTNDELLVAQRPLPVPTSFLIDQNWRLVAVYKGKVSAETALRELDRLALPFEERRSGTLPFPGRWNDAPRNFVMLNFASRLFQRGHFEEGIDLLTRYARFLEPQPLFPGVLEMSGMRCAEAGRNQEARELFQRALKLDPRRIEALHGLAELFSGNLIMRNFEEGLKYARRAAELGDYSNPKVLLTLAVCLKNVNRNGEAEGVVRQAMALPGVVGDKALRKRFEKLLGP
ncbi:MAG: ASPIC/UnbV domain-containing protein [Akkermansiaceae bacterium]|nr:ASPIC/UnbV domain-containing protein [Akkermansiaceae bacterium]MDG1364499.1 ASPIC/UnbV domain-containing protein [Akkermansiaceae bacterium]